MPTLQIHIKIARRPGVMAGGFEFEVSLVYSEIPSPKKQRQRALNKKVCIANADNPQEVQHKGTCL